MLILGVDPGKTTGFGLVQLEEKKLQLLGVRESRSEDLLDCKTWFEETDVVVCEAWLTRPNEARRGGFDWGVMYAAERLGSARTLASLYECKFVLQQPSQKPIGYAWANLKYVPGKSGTHQQDATAHAVYHAVHVLGGTPLSSGSSGSSSALRK